MRRCGAQGNTRVKRGRFFLKHAILHRKPSRPTSLCLPCCRETAKLFNISTALDALSLRMVLPAGESLSDYTPLARPSHPVWTMHIGCSH